jgi:hypothetical protein
VRFSLEVGGTILRSQTACQGFLDAVFGCCARSHRRDSLADRPGAPRNALRPLSRGKGPHPRGGGWSRRERCLSRGCSRGRALSAPREIPSEGCGSVSRRRHPLRRAQPWRSWGLAIGVEKKGLTGQNGFDRKNRQMTHTQLGRVSFPRRRAKSRPPCVSGSPPQPVTRSPSPSGLPVGPRPPERPEPRLRFRTWQAKSIPVAPRNTGAADGLWRHLPPQGASHPSRSPPW